ncbi:hypothetical protein AA0488_0779 [Kozakia baliensis NRIC 0488]|nr:hypothetical protein AA0488_0779 [Kozakia baliensis NRIC 0488]GEL64858.1 hypothetical protein KBA01_21440 [Kozakia baliensis]
MSGLSAAPSFRFRSRSTFGLDAVEQYTGWFIVWVLRDEFAPEGFGEKGGFEAVEEVEGALGFCFEAIRTGEGFYDP